ncbi:MAG TPA: hypothetical protein VER96_31445 [Polyangiaceae bacterium]|nr:hypothetical protein [Polyangiaceae bacterium]
MLRVHFLIWALASTLLSGCGAGAKPEPAPPCEQACQDGIALRGVRETMKLAYNLLIQARPVGTQDGTTDCRSSDGSKGGTVHVFGEATSNAAQGASFVDLEYDFDQCVYSVPPSATPNENYSLVITGPVTQQGTLAVQPSSTTALLIDSEGLNVSGTVYDPPLAIELSDCKLSVAQQGNRVSGVICGRNAGFTF